VPGNLPEQPEEAITNMAHHSREQADPQKRDVKKAVNKALDDLRKDHPDERVRKRADMILRDLDRLQGTIETTSSRDSYRGQHGAAYLGLT
jgi:hypothetical protein